MDQPNPRYTMRISRLTVDKLGVKLYDKVSAVLAELVANSYDADATEVAVYAPMGEFLATRQRGELRDKGFEITVTDNGHGMDPSEMAQHYLVVGSDRRSDPNRGDRSRSGARLVMGRKGVGKLAPFGICKKIEIISAGGPLVTEPDDNGVERQGYRIAHVILDSEQILSPTDADYVPEVGDRDGQTAERSGTTVRLRDFDKREVPDIQTLGRQLAQRFGLSRRDWTIRLHDNQLSEDAEGQLLELGAFELDVNDNTRITFEHGEESGGHSRAAYSNGELAEIAAGIEVEGRFYPITGWVAYANRPYRDDLMAGVRIYCNGKIAAQTLLFNMRAGFTGEHDIRSYFVGELHADWLDSGEDLIQTDRRDILWSSDLGAAFEEWGQRLVRIVGRSTRRALANQARASFLEASNAIPRITSAFPREDQEPLRRAAVDLARTLGERMRMSEPDEAQEAERIVNLVIRIAPHDHLHEALKAAADEQVTLLTVMSNILEVARVAELSSFGQIAESRVNVISKLQQVREDRSQDELALQQVITSAPWLIDPQWSPIVENRSFKTLRQALEEYLATKGINVALLEDVTDTRKRVDFALANFDGYLELVEIKRPGHIFDKDDFARFWRYVDLFTEFWDLPGNVEVVREFSNGFRFTLVADGINVGSVEKSALSKLMDDGRLTHINWASFLARARRAHQDFLEEADRQIRTKPLI